MASGSRPPLIVIVGPTASGKSSLALELAKKYNGEIICADSRTVYRGMDIGTAKPTFNEQKEIKHHLLDIVEPNQTFTAATFQKLAKKAIADIRGRGKVPFLVGGTGLYIDSIIFDYQFGGQPNITLRKELEEFSIGKLWDYCKNNKIKLPQNKYNKRYVIRAIEQEGINNNRRKNPLENCFIVGIATNKSELEKRITQRAHEMFASGVVEEAARLARQYGWKSEAMTANIYRLAYGVYKKEISQQEAEQRFVVMDKRLAKRQLTWLRRNPYIHWHPKEIAFEQISNFLDSRQIPHKRATM